MALLSACVTVHPEVVLQQIERRRHLRDRPARPIEVHRIERPQLRDRLQQGSPPQDKAVLRQDRAVRTENRSTEGTKNLQTERFLRRRIPIEARIDQPIEAQTDRQTKARIGARIVRPPGMSKEMEAGMATGAPETKDQGIALMLIRAEAT